MGPGVAVKSEGIARNRPASPRGPPPCTHPIYTNSYLLNLSIRLILIISVDVIIFIFVILLFALLERTDDGAARLPSLGVVIFAHNDAKSAQGASATPDRSQYPFFATSMHFLLILW